MKNVSWRIIHTQSILRDGKLPLSIVSPRFYGKQVAIALPKVPEGPHLEMLDGEVLLLLRLTLVLSGTTTATSGRRIGLVGLRSVGGS